MKRLLSLAIFALALTAEGAYAAPRWARFGPPPRGRATVVVRRPSLRHVWIPGYYRWYGGRYLWTEGYWTIPPRPRAVWVPGYRVRRPLGYVWISGYWR